MEEDKTGISAMVRAGIKLSDKAEIARRDIIIDMQQRQIRKLVSDKADLLAELNALYRTGAQKND